MELVAILNRQHFAREGARDGRGMRQAMRPHGELIHVFAGDPVLVGDQLRRLALRDQVVTLEQLGREPTPELRLMTLVDPEADVAHVLDATCDDNLIGLRLDPQRREVHCLLTGSAANVDRGGAGLLGKPLLEPRRAGDPSRLLACLIDAADDDVVDLPRVDAGSRNEALVGSPEEIRRMNVLVDALLGMPAPNRRANGIDNVGLAR